MGEPSASSKSGRFLALAAICGVVAGLYFARAVLIPLAVALLLTFLLAPLVHRLERLRLRRTPSVLIVVALSFALLGGIGWVISDQATELAVKLGDYQADIEHKIAGVHHYLGGGVWAKASSEIATMAKEVVTTQPDGVGQTWANRGTKENPVAVEITSSPETPSALGTVRSALDIIAPMAQFLVVIVFVVFMLIQREDIRDRVIRLVGHGQLTVTTRALDEAATRISRYLAAQSAVNGIYGILVALGLYLIHIPNAPLWGLLCALLRFVPYVGIWIGALFPIILSAVLPEGYYTARPFLTLGLFALLEIVAANAVEPLLFGARTGLSPLAILVAAVFWTWLWGGIGLLLSTPLTVLLAVAGKYVPQLAFLDILLGDQPVLSPPERYYQRLLAEDAEEAEDLLDEFEKDRNREQLFSQIMLPALVMAQRDFRAGILDEGRLDFILQVMSDEIEDAGQPDEKSAQVAEKKDDTVKVPRDATIRIALLPAHNRVEEIAGLMLASLLQGLGYTVTPISASSLASERVEVLSSEKVDVVVISAMPPGAAAHARYVCKRVRAKLPEIRLVIGLWHVQGITDKLRHRLTSEANAELATQFDEALRQIHQMAQPLLIRETDESPPPQPPVPSLGAHGSN